MARICGHRLSYYTLDGNVVFGIVLDNSSVGSLLVTLEVFKIFNLEFVLGTAEQSHTVISYREKQI
jgi:hypothetical protein